MANLTRRGAANVTTDLDKLAILFQIRAAALGIPAKIAQDFAYRCDLLSDHIEKHATRLAGESDEEAEDDDFETASKKAAIDETGTSIEPGPDNNGFDANQIGDEVAGPLDIITPPDEPWMAGHFTQEKFVSLAEKQQSGELASNAASGKADAKLASLDASLAKLAKLAKLAAVGPMTDMQAELAIKRLTELDAALSEAGAELEVLAGAVLVKQKGLDAEHKKILQALKDALPTTITGQKATILKVRSAIIKYTKSPERKPPGYEQMKSPNVNDPKEKGGALFLRIEEKLGAEIAKQVEIIAETVKEELSHLSTPVRGLKYELDNVSKTASGKSAGVLDMVIKFRSWIASQIGKMMMLFKLGSQAIDGAAKSITDAIAKADDEYAMVSKTASGSGAANAAFLRQSPLKNKILQAVAKHYDTSVSAIMDELTDPDAEALYEYIGNDAGLQTLVYREFSKTAKAKKSEDVVADDEDEASAKKANSDYNLFGR